MWRSPILNGHTHEGTHSLHLARIKRNFCRMVLSQNECKGVWTSFGVFAERGSGLACGVRILCVKERERAQHEKLCTFDNMPEHLRLACTVLGHVTGPFFACKTGHSSERF